METREEILAPFADPKVRLAIYEDVKMMLMESKIQYDLYMQTAYPFRPSLPYLCYRILEVEHPAMIVLRNAGYSFASLNDEDDVFSLPPVFPDLIPPFSLTAVFPELIPPANWYSYSMWGAPTDYDLRINIVTKAIELVKELI